MKEVTNDGWDNENDQLNEIPDHEDCEETVAGGRDSKIHTSK